MVGIIGSEEHREDWETRHERDMDPRKNLTNYLRMYWHGDIDRLQLKLTLRAVDASGGKQLNPVAVGRWEVEHALARLGELDLLQLAAIRLHLEFGFGWRRIARETGHSPSTVQQAYESGLTWLVEHIYDWTEGGRALARQAELAYQAAHERREATERG